MSNDRNFRRDGLSILAAALAVRLGFWLLFRGQEPRGDEVWYWHRAGDLLEGELGLLERGPGQVAFLALCRAFGGGLAEARLAGAILGVVVPLCVWDLGRALGSVWTARAAGLIAAFAPPLVGYSQFLWSEGLATALLWLGFWAICRAPERRATPWLALGGALLGGAALTRVQWILAVPAAAAWWAVRGASERRARLRGALLVIGVAAAVVTPWALRNWERDGAPVGLVTQRWMPVAAGVLYPPQEGWFLGPTEAGELRAGAPTAWRARDRYWRSAALDGARDRWPEILWKKPIRNLSRLWGLHGQAVRWVEKGWWQGDPRLARLLVLFDAGGTAALLLLAIPALALRGRSGDLPVWLVFAAIHCVHLAANATPRFLVPMWPGFALVAGRLFEASTPADATRRRVAAALVLAWLVSVSVRWGVDVAPAWSAL